MSSRHSHPKSKSPSPTAAPPPDGAQRPPTSQGVSNNPETVPSPAAAEQPQDPADGPINTQIPFESLRSTSSLAESIFDYRNIHGRTFQNSKTTEYWGPNDDRQNTGLDIAHHFITMLKGDRLFEAPIDRPLSKVLDVGTGTGIWAIDMADTYPAARVIGTDISPIQPAWVPPNCEFHIDDAQLEWTYAPASFDFVHIRALYGSVGDWGRLYAQAYKALRPGGWLEDLEFNITLHSDTPSVRDDPGHIFKRWSQFFFEATDRLGKTLRIGMGSTMRDLIAEAGFIDVVEKKYQVPSGGWSSDPRMKIIGRYNLAFLEESLEGFALFLLQEIMGWSFIQVNMFVMEMRNEIRNSKIRPYYILTNVYAQKPNTAE
ncbi:putative SAM dependent methyltransferase [Chaetomium sp. MPI-CAGE-AT-0009]|nr:putative SAM dependent methyltransferase [Chaetomium sp. MPI-CAGE-AT-0009]